jgi:hypothetical protein
MARTLRAASGSLPDPISSLTVNPHFVAGTSKPRLRLRIGKTSVSGALPGPAGARLPDLHGS